MITHEMHRQTIADALHRMGIRKGAFGKLMNLLDNLIDLREDLPATIDLINEQHFPEKPGKKPAETPTPSANAAESGESY